VKFEARTTIEPATYFAFRLANGEKAHLAEGPGLPALCSERQRRVAIGEPIDSGDLELTGEPAGGNMRLCFVCQKNLKVLKRIAERQGEM